MENQTETPIPQPKGQIVIRIAAFMPHPENPAVGDLVEAAPIAIEVLEDTTALPAGLLVSLRGMMEEFITLAKAHVHAPLPAQQPQVILANENDAKKAVPCVELYRTDGTGPLELVNSVPLIMGAGGAEIEQ